MFGFLPEKVYAKIKEDASYKTYEVQVNTAVATTCLIDRIIKEELLDKDTLMTARNEVITRLCTEEEQRSVTIIETSDKVALLALLETETDAENILLIYQQLVGICLFASNPEAEPYMNEFITICKNTNNDFCEKIWEEYFTFVCFQKLISIFKSRIYNPNGFDELKAVMETVGAEVAARFGQSDYITDLIQHIKIKMTFYYFGYLLDYHGTISPIEAIIKTKIIPYAESLSFKYASFNLFKLRIYDATAKYYFDRRDPQYFTMLAKVTELLNAAIAEANRPTTIKAVNYYNDRLGFDLLNIISMYRKVTKELIPEFRQSLDITLLTEKELAITATTDSSVAEIKAKYNLDGVVNSVVEALCQKQANFMNTYLAGNDRHYEYMRTLYQISL